MIRWNRSWWAVIFKIFANLWSLASRKLCFHALVSFMNWKFTNFYWSWLNLKKSTKRSVIRYYFMSFRCASWLKYPSIGEKFTCHTFPSESSLDKSFGRKIFTRTTFDPKHLNHNFICHEFHSFYSFTFLVMSYVFYQSQPPFLNIGAVIFSKINCHLWASGPSPFICKLPLNFISKY